MHEGYSSVARRLQSGVAAPRLRTVIPNHPIRSNMTFEMPTRLRGRLLTLRRQQPVSDRYREPVFRGFFTGALASGGALVVIDNRDGALIGSVAPVGRQS
jgi:hypothetical protein